jgi:hypothetical protein
MILDGEEEEKDEGSGSQETAGFRVPALSKIGATDRR